MAIPTFGMAMLRSSPQDGTDGSLGAARRAHQGGAVADLLSNTDRALRRCRHPVARAAEATGQPLGVVLLGEPWVLYRSGGEVRAFADRCIEIPALGAGATLPPAAHLEPAAGTAEAHGMVFVAPDEPIAPLGTIPEADYPSFMTGVLPTLRPRCPPTPWRVTTGPSP